MKKKKIKTIKTRVKNNFNFLRWISGFINKIKQLFVFKKQPKIVKTIPKLPKKHSSYGKRKKYKDKSKVVIQKSEAVAPTQYERLITGIVDYVSPLYAYIIIDETDESIYIKKIDLKGALHKDHVIAMMLYEKNKSHYIGYVKQVISRANDFFVGTLYKDRDKFFVLTNNKKMYDEIIVPIDNVNTIHANLNDRVTVKITEYNVTGSGCVKGEIINIIGKAGIHEVEMNTLCLEFKLPQGFSDEVMNYVNTISETIPQEEIARRLDYRSVFTMTIDPTTAKDFDDAISIQKISNGHYEVGVHIADVSYYLKEGSVLDKEAYNRNTSVYMIDRVIPMLPEKLCNNLCSLVPNQDRLTMSIIFEIDSRGHVYNYWIGETVIHSNERFTYEQAQKALDVNDDKYHNTMSTLFTISQNLRKQRFNHGSINFETDNIEFLLEGTDKHLIYNEIESLDSHHLVEEFMLLANKYVATYAFNIKDAVFIYRAHDTPERIKVDDFNSVLNNFKCKPLDVNNLPKSINDFLNKIKNKPEAGILRQLAIRMMPKAFYTTENKEHFGLAFAHYSHFTSPIRRYPDVVAHRLLKKYVKNEYIYEPAKYNELCKYALEREKIASDAERASIKYKQVEYVMSYQGQKLLGVITGLNDNNAYINLPNMHCDGCIILNELTDYYVYNRNTNQISAKRSKVIYNVGDHVDVIITRCDKEKRIIYLTFA